MLQKSYKFAEKFCEFPPYIELAKTLFNVEFTVYGGNNQLSCYKKL